MLILSDADGPGRARLAGWSLSAWGWRCPKHIDLPGDPVAEPFPPAAAPTAAPAAVTG